MLNNNENENLQSNIQSNIQLNENTHLVVDNGSGMVKAGFSGEDAPRCIFPSIIGRTKYQKIQINRNVNTNANTNTNRENEVFIGEDAQSKRGVLKLNYPIEHGVVTNWDDMQLLWKYTFDNQLRVDPTEHNVLLTEAPQNPKKNREKMTEIMFEIFKVPGTFIAIQGVLSLYASGRTTGIVMDIGDGVTHTIPVYEGYYIPHAVNRYDLAGRDITDYMMRLLEEKGNRFSTSSDREIVRRIKEKFTYCASDYESEIKLYKTRNMTRRYTLPDGTIITLNEEMFKAPEVLFNPELAGKELNGIDYMINNSIQTTDMDVRSALYSNIVLSGGTTTIKNLDKRLEKEINRLKPPKLKPVTVIAPNERKYSVWLGGSILTSLHTFNSAWIKREDYDECGSHIIHKKCM